MHRRLFFSDLAKYAALAATTPTIWRLEWNPRYADDPFALGVASGDPTPDGAVLWTRLAPRPLEAEGGMDGRRVSVRWQVAEDEGFARITQQGNATAAPELGYSIHANVRGLHNDRWYFYRFTSGDAASAVGRLRTTPADGGESPLRFVSASCSHYEEGLFTAYGHLATEEVDLVAHLGDYIYENAGLENRVRKHAGLEIQTLDDYRRRYAQYKSDEHLRAAHARCPWLIVWDDHEVDNNYAGSIGENNIESEEQMRARRAAAYQAWYEHMPVRVPRARSWADLTIYRSANWGRLARFWALDTRQYRWDQACGDGSRAIPCGDYADPNRTILGDSQERWLLDGLRGSQSRWQVLAQQVGFAPPDEPVKAGDRVSMDTWQGYPLTRDRVCAAMGDAALGRAVVLTGDIHNNWVYDVRRGFDRTERPVIAAEFVATSISSGGDGGDNIARVNDAYLAARPSLKWANNRRGYILHAVTPTEWRADYRVVPFVSRPGAPIQTASQWRLKHGRPGVSRLGA